MRTLKSVVVALALSVTVVGAGCVALAVGAAAGVGTYAYVEGKLKTTFEASLDKTWNATKAAMGDLQFPITEQSKDALEARLVAKEADGTSVKIDLERTSDALTEVSVRIGTFGDESRSRLIMDKIKAKL